MGVAAGFVDVAAADAVLQGQMVHVEVAGRELLIANVDGTLHAMAHRCSHEGRTSGERLDGTVVTCPANGSRFDITTGSDLPGQVMADLTGLERLSARARENAAEMTNVHVSDLPAYRTGADNGRVFVEA